LDDVKKDYASRLADSLIFQQMKLISEGRDAEAKSLARFRNPHKNPYALRLVAGVVHEKDNWDNEFFTELPAKHKLKAQLEIVVICVENLGPWIEEVHRKAADVAGE
jgi:hypothetical protein